MCFHLLQIYSHLAAPIINSVRLQGFLHRFPKEELLASAVGEGEELSSEQKIACAAPSYAHFLRGQSCCFKWDLSMQSKIAEDCNPGETFFPTLSRYPFRKSSAKL